MSFVVGVDGPHGLAQLAHTGRHLAGLGEGDPGVVATVGDQQSRPDPVGIGQGINAGEELLHGGIAFVAVLGPPEILPVRAGVLEETAKTGDADHIDPRPEAVGVMGQRGQHHVAPVRATHDGDPLGIEFGLTGDPVKQGANVFDAVFAERAVVEPEVGAAIAGGTADVGMENGDPQLMTVELVGPLEAGAILRLGSAMDVDEDGDAAGGRGSLGGEVVGGDLPSIETGEADQPGGDELPGIQSSRLAEGPLRETTGGQIDGEGVGRGVGSGERETELPPVGMELEAGDCPQGERQLPTLSAFDDVQSRGPVGVGGEGDASAGAIEFEFGDIPGNVGGDPVPGSRLAIEAGQLAKLAAGVGCHPDGATVGTELHGGAGCGDPIGQGEGGQLA